MNLFDLTEPESLIGEHLKTAFFKMPSELNQQEQERLVANLTGNNLSSKKNLTFFYQISETESVYETPKIQLTESPNDLQQVIDEWYKSNKLGLEDQKTLFYRTDSSLYVLPLEEDNLKGTILTLDPEIKISKILGTGYHRLEFKEELLMLATNLFNERLFPKENSKLRSKLYQTRAELNNLKENPLVIKINTYSIKNEEFTTDKSY